MNRTTLLIGGGSFAVGAAAGSLVTYFVVKKRITTRVQAQAEEDIQSVKDTYKLLRKEPPYDDPATAAKAYIERLDELAFYTREGVDAAEVAAIHEVNEAAEALADAREDLAETEAAAEEADEILESQGYTTQIGKNHVRNIFDEAAARASQRQSEKSDVQEPLPDDDEYTIEPGDDRGDELTRRDPNVPYVISFDEFFDDSNDFEKLTITYYEGDDTLADERDQPIPDVDGVVGRDNLQKFGQDSNSRHTVYIRNERLQIDYEVTHDDDDYASSVFGLREEASKQRVKRMRDDE